MKRTLYIAALAAVLCVAPFSVSAQSAAGGAGGAGSSGFVKPVKTGYAPVNGLKLYYEIYGSGSPVILIHGGFGAIEMFAPILPALSKGRQVIAVDLQAHGRTGDVDRPFSYQAFADDIGELISYLGFAKADVMGYSMGGEVALQTAIRHPAQVRKLVLVSTAFRQNGWYPEVLAGEAQITAEAAEPMKQSPMYQAYASVAPKLQDWNSLVVKTGDLMRQNYDWSADTAKLTVPLLIVAADADAVKTAHTLEFYGLFGGGKNDAGWDGSRRPRAQLAVLSNHTHYGIFMSPALVAAVAPFLDEAMPGSK